MNETRILELILECLLNDQTTDKLIERHKLIAQNLFVRRDPLYLEKRDGIVEPVTELPLFLRESPLEGSSLFYGQRFVSEGNLVPTGFNHAKWFSLPETKDLILAYWSGQRSCITADLSTGQLYRLKGMAVGDKPLVVDDKKDAPFFVYGGQFLTNAYNELDYSRKFNNALVDNGIEPVMEYVGLYKLPVRARRKHLATSIIKILGDTRLDEFFYALEYDAWNSRAFAEKDYGKISPFFTEAAIFYKDIGYIVGRLKKLMELQGLSWSDNPNRSNAHIGNIVLYKTNENSLGIGLVDFDASCDRRDKSKIALRQQQKQERLDIFISAKEPMVSARPFGNCFYGHFYFEELRNAFGMGFCTGWKDSTRREVNNKLEMERLKHLTEKLENLGSSQKINKDQLSDVKVVQLDEYISEEKHKIVYSDLYHNK